MATLVTKSGAVTLLDWAKSIDPDGKTAAVAELLSQTNEILLDMPWMEGNLPTGHRGTLRTALPSSVWRKLYQGVPPSKSARATVEDSVGMLESRSEVDKDIAELNGNSDSFRLSEAQAFLEGMNQDMCETLIYGDASLHPERFTGLAARYNTISTGTSEVARNVIDASAGGGTGNNTSMWLVVWGKDTVHGIFPKGSKAGLQHENLGLIDAFDSNNNRYRAYADHWQWKCGIHVRDWRYIVRIANINMTHLLALSNTQAVTASTYLPKLMIKALARIPFQGKGNAAFYCSRTVKEMLSIGAMDKNQNVLSVQESAKEFGNISTGFPQGAALRFLGVPIRTVDRILETETALT